MKTLLEPILQIASLTFDWIITLLESLGAWLNLLWDYLGENSAAFICAYLAIIIEALWKKYARERKAKQSYLSLLGTFLEQNTIPDKDGLISLKNHFSKHFNVKSSSFSISAKALEELYLLYETDAAVSLERKAILQDKIAKFQKEFSEQDSLVEATPYYVSYRDTLRKDFLIDFGIMLALLTLSNPPKTFVTALINSLLAMLATIVGIMLYWIFSYILHKAKLFFRKHGNDQQQPAVSTTENTNSRTQEATRQKT